MSTLTLEQNIEQQFHRLAEETHRTESEIIHEALVSYLAADRRYIEILSQRLAAAERGEFASDGEVEAFFAGH